MVLSLQFTELCFYHSVINFLFISPRIFLCRVDKLMISFIIIISSGGLDEPTMRAYVERDWQFGHYEMEYLQDPLSCFFRWLLQPFSTCKKMKALQDDDELIL